ncbi:polyhomeotic-like protein 3 [Limulus polyphemus]|uniref:Polyhomeotic-like protein 3 n=1 Tax=Limulus polyphemus TaxID=6850 RepID=A0ABM1TCM3_LIMPO|nr:polyhomeotic-like protein 3 [Limulus polyphemus]
MSAAKATPQLPATMSMSVSNTGVLTNEAAPAIQSSASIVVSSSPISISSIPSHPQQTHTPTTFFTVSSPVSSAAVVTTMGPPSTPAPQPHPQLAPSSLQPQNHAAPQGIQHPTIPNVLPSPLAQVQVIHQPLHNPAYVQQLYTPQQQMLLPGGLTIQSASMAPTLQSLGMAPAGLSLQLQSKGPLDPKTQGVAVTGPTLIPTSPLQTVNTLGKGLGISTANLVSGAGQVVATGGKSSMPGQVITAKSTTVIQGQSGFVPATTSQTVVIGQLGVLSSQPSILPTQSKGFLDNQKGKSFVINHNAALQPKSPIFPSPVSSVGSTAQVLTSTQLKQLTSSPQLITTQATGAMLAGHSHILGSFQALGAPLGQGITWATPGGLQSPALLAQNPIFIRSQQSDMFIQSSPAAPGTIQAVPVAAAATPGPISATSNHIPKQKQISRSSLLTDTTNSKPLQTEKQPKPEVTTSTKVVLLDNKDKSLKGSGEIAKCEFCGKLGPKSKFKRSKRFCSTSCAKRYNVGCSKRLSLFPSPDQQPVTVTGKVMKKKIGYKARKGWRKSQSGRLSYNIAEWQQNQELNNADHSVIEMEAESEGSGKAEQGTEENEGEETTDTPSGPESSMSPTTPSSHREEMEVDLPYTAPFGNKNPLKWTVQEVFDFVNGLPGCSDYAEEFRSQEIDGQALMLLKEDHLMSAMNMKLGPALKICSHITSLKDENNT